MAGAADILNDPNYINANAATKKAIFDSRIATLPEYNNANFATQTQIQQRFGLSAAKAAPPMSLMNVGSQAFKNVPSSAMRFGQGIAEAVTHPVKTAGGLLDLVAGGAYNAMPTKARNFLIGLDSNPEAAQRAISTAKQVGGVYQQRYGSIEALKQTLATDPVGVAADLSTLFSGGAGLARGTASVARAAPRVAAGATRTANILSQAAKATNPVNALTKPAAAVARGVSRVPLAVQRFVSPKQAAYLQATEGRSQEFINQLRSPDLEIVPGSKPTAAQAAAPLGGTEFSALGESARQVLPTAYYAREGEQAAARQNAIRDVGGTPANITAASDARTAASNPLYAAAEARKFAADPALMQLADDPYIRQALPDATRLSKSQNVTFTNNPTRFIHNVKISLDKMLTRTGDTALARGERAQVMDVKNRLVGWLDKNAPEYGAARAVFADKSKPINQMEVGQYLEGKLTTSLGTGERANVFATAVKDAAGTIKRATTNEARFKALSDVLTPDQVRAVNAIRDDLARAAKNKDLARAGGGGPPNANKLASQAAQGAQLPNLLSRVAAVANNIISRLKGRIDRNLAVQLATEMLDPQAAAAAIEKAATGERRAKATGQVLVAAPKLVGRAARSKATLAGERAQNAMRDQEQF
jgi:hypothetical protein